jgi:aspartokinase/homoserine dehydrogenase 1
MTTLMMKFGGTSVGSAQAFAAASDIVLEQSREWERLIVVVSAMNGVTDNLIEGAQSASRGEEQTYRAINSKLRDRHHAAVDQLLLKSDEREPLLAEVDRFLEDYYNLCRSIYVLGEFTPRAMDTISSRGERMSARILAALLRYQGGQSKAIDATSLIITDKQFQNATPLMDVTRDRILEELGPRLDDGTIPIVTGFIGATEEGLTTTLGRGGSDYTAAILGSCLKVDEVWIWTDVDGVMTADPRILPDARVIPVLSYSEVSELAYFGAKVLHPRTIRPIVEQGIPLWIKNTFNPTSPGTSITLEPENSNGKVKAVTAIEKISVIMVEGRGMRGVPGIAGRTFSAVASEGASVIMITQASSEQSICFVIPMDTVQPVIQAIETEMKWELARRDIDRIRSLDDMVIVTVVGAGLRKTSGISGQIFSTLGKAGINIFAIAQGSSESSLSIVVAANESKDAVRQIHREVIING